MSAVGDSPSRIPEGSIPLEFDHQEQIKQSLNKIQGLLTSIFHLPEGKLPSYKSTPLADASLSLSDTPVMTPVQPWRVGSFTHYAHTYNDDYYNQTLNTMLLGVAIELKKIRDLSVNNNQDLETAIEDLELISPFPETAEENSKGFFKFISSLHQNIDFINKKLATEGLTQRKLTILSAEGGQQRFEKYWQTVNLVQKVIGLILTKDSSTATSSSSSDAVETDELAEIIQTLSNGSTTSRNPFRESSIFIGFKMRDLNTKLTGKLTKKYSAEEWKKAKLMSKDNQWYVDTPEFTEEIKSLVKDDLEKDLERCNYTINGQNFSKDGRRVDEMIQAIKTTLFGEEEDRMHTAYRLAFLLTQGTLSIPLDTLLFSSNNFFGEMFLFDSTEDVNFDFNYNPSNQVISIQSTSVQRSFKNDQENGRVRMTVNLQLKLENGTIDWNGARATYTLNKIK